MSRSLATQAQVLWEAGGASRQTSLLLALEALKHFPTWEADQSVRRGLRELPVHLGRIRDVGRLADLRVSYDGRYFATSSNASGIRVWVTDGLKELAGLRQEEASTAVFSPVRNDLLFGKDGFLHIVEVPSGRSRGALRHHRQDVIPLAISADGKYLLTEQYDVSEAGFIERRELLLWDLPAQRRIRSVETQSTVGQNYGDAFFFTTPFGTYLAAGWRLYEVWGLDGAAAGQYQAEGLLSPNGAYVLEFEDRQGGWKILNRQSRQVVLQGDEPLDRGRFSPDGLYAFLDSWGRPLQIWSLEQRTKVGEINLTSDPRILERDGSTAVVGYEVMARTSTVRLTPDRKVLLAETRIGDDYHLDAWETRSHISTASFDADWQIHDVDLSPRGDRLAIASGRDFRTWDLELHRKAVDIPHQSLQEHILSISYRPDGSELALGVDGGSFGPERGVVLWDLRAQRRQRVLALDSIVTAVAYSPSGRFLAIAAAPSSDSRRDVGALIWDLSRQADTVEKLPESDSTKNVVWSPDGRYLLLASGSDTLIVELARRRTVFRQRWSASASFDRTGNLLVMAVDNRAQIWRLDLVGGRHALLAELFADANIACAAFAPDGVHVATGSVRGVLSIWNRKTKQAVSRIELGEPLRNLAFTPDGRLVVYASEGHVLASVWRPKDLIEEGFRRTADPLTAEQWKQYLGDFRPYPYGEQRLPEVEKRLSASTASRERPGQAAGRPR